MAKKKLKKNCGDTSSVVGLKETRQNVMTQPEQFHTFSFAAVVLVVGVFVVPLTAEVSNVTCKYP